MFDETTGVGMDDLLNDALSAFQGTAIEAQEDVENEIKPLDGKYVAEIKRYNKKDWEDGSSSISFNLAITETVSGVKGEGRYVSKNYSLGKTQYKDANANMEALLKGLKTIGAIENAPKNGGELLAVCESCVGRLVNVKLRPQRDGKDIKLDKSGWPKHFVTIVDKFDVANPVGATEAVSSDSPF